MMDVLKYILHFKKNIKNIQNMYNLILISKKNYKYSVCVCNIINLLDSALLC